MVDYNLSRPWLTLDTWQKEYIKTSPNTDCFLLTGRQVGKTTAMSIKAVELCVNHFTKGENVLIASLTEKQGYLMLSKALAYAQERYPRMILGGKERPTKHEIRFKNGTRILCYAAGESGEGLRGFTIKKLMIDEGSRMSEAFFVAVQPTLSVTKGSMDIASTPCGKTGFFYECSKDDHFVKFYVSGEDCSRHDKDFLELQKKRLSKLMYAQEYLALFLDDLRRFYPDEIIKAVCTANRRENMIYGDYFLGIDVGGMGEDESAFQIIDRQNRDFLVHIDSITMKKKYTNDVTQEALELHKRYKFRRIYVDDGGIGFGVFSYLLKELGKKVIAINNSARPLDRDAEKTKKILKEDLHNNLLMLMEQKKIKLLNDDELIASLRSVQYEYVIKEGQATRFRIYGDDTHKVEALIRAVWCNQDKTLLIWAM